MFATSRRTGRDPRIATRCIRLLGRDSDRRGFLLLLLLLLAVFRAEYFRFRFWESDDDDDVSGVRGVDRIGEYRKEDDRDMDCGIEVEENDSGTYVDYLYGTMTKERLDWM